MRNLLAIDTQAEAVRIAQWIRETVLKTLGRKGAIVAISGGIDSSVVAALCVPRWGRSGCSLLMLPESESSDDNARLGQLLAESVGVPPVVENITADARGGRLLPSSRRGDPQGVPEYRPGWTDARSCCPASSTATGTGCIRIVVQAPDGDAEEARGSRSTRTSASSPRRTSSSACRKMLEYYHADRLNYAVAGTPNRLEYDQGFFVKLGDGAADVKPIAHLYKTQVYALAEQLGVPEEIRSRPPTTDTYSLPQTQEEFYFSLPYDEMDLCLYAHEHGVAAAEVPARWA